MITRQRNNKIKNDNETTTITSGDNQIITHNEREKQWEREIEEQREEQNSRERTSREKERIKENKKIIRREDKQSLN